MRYGPAWLLGVILLSVACHRGPPPDTDIPPDQAANGGYDYVATIRGTEVQGFFVVSGSTVIFNAKGGSCKRTVKAPTAVPAEMVQYECAGLPGFRQVDFFVHLRNPITQSTWRTTFTAQKTRQVCTAGTSRSPARGRTCSTESYDEETTINGGLVVRRNSA